MTINQWAPAIGNPTLATRGRSTIPRDEYIPHTDMCNIHQGVAHVCMGNVPRAELYPVCMTAYDRDRVQSERNARGRERNARHVWRSEEERRSSHHLCGEAKRRRRLNK